MRSLEARQELSLDFMKVAEQAAMEKVIDIHQAKALKHSFVTSCPPAFKATFNDTRRITPSSEDTLRQILHVGLIAENFAKKARIPIKRNFKDPANETNVSLSDSGVSLTESFRISVIAILYNALTHGHGYPYDYSEIPRENVYIILVENKPYANAKKKPEERLAKNRVSPKFFKGIVFIDGAREEQLSRTLHDGIDFKSATTQETVDIITKKMLPIYRERPNLCIPVYGLSGDLYWPKEMSYQEVQELVSVHKS
jgi:hypothetical protein